MKLRKTSPSRSKIPDSSDDKNRDLLLFTTWKHDYKDLAAAVWRTGSVIVLAAVALHGQESHAGPTCTSHFLQASLSFACAAPMCNLLKLATTNSARRQQAKIQRGRRNALAIQCCIGKKKLRSSSSLIICKARMWTLLIVSWFGI